MFMFIYLFSIQWTDGAVVTEMTQTGIMCLQVDASYISHSDGNNS